MAQDIGPAVVLGRPEHVCWTRMQAEAGQALTTIVRRKEHERVACDGHFFWGVGNAPSRLTRELAYAKRSIPVIFSIMKSAPKPRDLKPNGILVWQAYQDVGGAVRQLPPGSLVSSRVREGSVPRHYALACKSGAPLALSDYGAFDSGAFRNAGGTGLKIGASQVTALAERVRPDSTASDYRVNLQAELTGAYWVKLCDPILLSSPAQHRTYEAVAAPGLADDEWLDLVMSLRSQASRAACRTGLPLLLAN